MKKYLIVLAIVSMACSSSRNSLDVNLDGEAPLKVDSYADLSTELITKVRAGENVDDITETLAKVSV